jgi:polysaccharide deacetylase family protein (PEP-CTERM system associated)
MKNALTIDLEDYYHVSAFRHTVGEEHWGSHQSRVERNTDLLLELLAEAGHKATFFTLGWIAKQFPRLVRKVAEQGHEVACHSLRHRIVYELSPEEFREDTLCAKALLEDACGVPVRGYRAPSFSITRDSLWAFEILAELGFTYDSSIFPVKHPNYGMPDTPRTPFLVNTKHGPLIEFPLPTLEFAGARSPLCGGAYLRFLPYWYTRWGICYLNGEEQQSVCVYLHPWEIDPDQPRLKGPITSRLRHTLGLRGLDEKLRRLLRDFQFCPMSALLNEVEKVEYSFGLRN